MDPSTTHGPLIHSRAVDKVEAHIQDAVSKGARVIQGGKRGEGSFFEPTVLVDIPSGCDLATEETFGPLAAVFKFETEEEVVKKANDTEFGLAAYLFTQDTSRKFRVGESLKVGMVGINTGSFISLVAQLVEC